MDGVANLHVTLHGFAATLNRREKTVEVKVLRDHIVYRPKNDGQESHKPESGRSCDNETHAELLHYSIS